jgi:hypothetical protein
LSISSRAVLRILVREGASSILQGLYRPVGLVNRILAAVSMPRNVRTPPR